MEITQLLMILNVKSKTEQLNIFLICWSGRAFKAMKVITGKVITVNKFKI